MRLVSADAPIKPNKSWHSQVRRHTQARTAHHVTFLFPDWSNYRIIPLLIITYSFGIGGPLHLLNLVCYLSSFSAKTHQTVRYRWWECRWWTSRDDL